MSPAMRRPAVGAGASFWPAIEIFGLTLLAHTWAGGSLPQTPWLVGMAVLIGATTRFAITRRAGVLTTLGTLMGGQFALHLLLAAMAPPGDHHGSAVHDVALLNASWEMLAAHGASAAATLIIWRTRRRLAGAIIQWLDVAVAPVLTAQQALIVRESASGFHRIALLIAPRRGPPVGFARS